jgi:uncharacterized protein YyaL (SSP411 family)
MAEERKPNRLVREKSPYLLQHAYNPVDWFPWGAEAFAAARAQNRPIFLSVGYSTCHWCHVMERESFENPTIASLLNDHFISIKVDREERPDVDRVYMTFVQSTTGSGGWPMSIFLTPDLNPFLGGTYYPPEDSYGRPGFGTLLTRLAEIWKDTPDKIAAQGEHFARAIQAHLQEAQAKASAPLNRDWLELAYRQLASGYDPEDGGFTAAPKFPRAAVFAFLFRYWKRSHRDAPLDMALVTLRKMAAGGIYDHLGGGFHRYSVDGRWHVPHFEKMLYDQAQLAVVYTEAFQITQDRDFERVARETLAYVLQDLRAREGGFYSAEDADSLPATDSAEKREGAFYVWTREEIDGALTPDEAAVFRHAYGVEAAGNVSDASDPHGELRGRNVLYIQNDAETIGKLTGKSSRAVESLLVSARTKLKSARDRRPRPHLDDKVVACWNGMMISALAKGYQVFSDQRYLETAERAARFLKTEMFPGRLLRSYREGPGATYGFAEDYAFLIQGLLDLYEADFQIEWLKWAGELQLQMNALFGDLKGGYFSTESAAPDILFRMKDDHDGAEPSANSVAALNLVRLARILDKEELQDSAGRIIGCFTEILDRMPVALPQMLAAMEALVAEPMQIVIAPGKDPHAAANLLDAVQRRFLPHKVVVLADAGDGQAWLGKQVEAVRNMEPIGGKPTAYICHNFACDLPITDPEILAKKLDTL